MYRSFGFVVLGLSGVAISEITVFAYPELFPGSGFASTLRSPGDQPGQRGKPQPVAWLVADLAGMAAQHCVLMPEDQEFGVIGHLTPGPNHQAAEHTAHEEVDDREEHSAMFPARRPARSINRASQVTGSH
jgi:hypothetical protein